MPGVAPAGTQRQFTELFTAVNRQVVVIAVSIRAVAAVQRGPGVTGRHAQAPVIRQCRVQPHQHAVGRGLIARRIGVARRMVPGPQQLRPGTAVVVRLDVRRGRQPFRLPQTAVQRITQVTAVVDLCRGDIRMDLPGQLTERLTRFPCRTGVENALVHRIARRQSIRRCRYRTFVLGGGHAGKTGVVTADVQRDLIGLIGQPGAEEQVVRCHRIKPSADALLGGQNVVLLAEQAANFALRQQIGAVLQRDGHFTAADRCRSAALDPIALAIGRHFHRVARTRLEADVTRHVQRADRVARRHGTAAAGGQ
ncbi:Uncharacterised protein [Serratia quinivorans]|nr:Uncharacterised protein [Serratia quinivorans]